MLLDVSPILAIMDKILIDTCLIDRDAEADVFDPVLGTYTSAARIKIYQGPCSIASLKTTRPTARSSSEGGALSIDVSVWLTLPLRFLGEILPKDLVTVVSSNNPNLVKQMFTVREDAETSTYSVSRRFLLHKFTKVPT